MGLLKFADLFCGAGGTTTGAESTGEAECVFAVNHWDRAVETHSANHPTAKHARKLVGDVGPSECPRIGGLFASPSCTHHSRARGGRPTSDQQRSGAWEIMPWVEHHRPHWIVVENVPEFRDWGPVGRDGIPLASGKGKLFDAWIKAIQSHGYKTAVFILNAADFGAATSRQRLFVICRKGRKAVHAPEPTHARPASGRQLPGFSLPAWRAAAEVIDWSLPCPSLFARTRPLADKTLSRIEAGLRKFVGPFVAQWDQTGSRGNPVRSVHHPLPTLLTKANNGIAIPFQYKLIGNSPGLTRGMDAPVPTIVASRENHGLCVPYLVPNFGEREGQSPRSHSIQVPAPTITGHGAGGLVVPYLATVNHGDNGSDRTADLRQPIGTLTGSNGRGIVVPFLSQYYGTLNQCSTGCPVPTITTTDRHAFVQALIDPSCLDWPEPVTEAQRSLQATMRELGVADIGFRMLQNHELAAAQGFPADYVFHGTKSEVTKQIGNSVSPPVAKAITLSLLG